MRMHGRLARHAESVVIPLLAPDVPVVTWWHDAPPDLIATDPLGVLGERRITDTAQAADPVAALRQRAEDYAPGDTDLAWTRTTPWRALLAGTLDTAAAPVVAAVVTAEAGDPTAELLRGWLGRRLGITPTTRTGGSGVHGVIVAAGRRRGDRARTRRRRWPGSTAPACRRGCCRSASGCSATNSPRNCAGSTRTSRTRPRWRRRPA